VSRDDAPSSTWLDDPPVEATDCGVDPHMTLGDIGGSTA